MIKEQHIKLALEAALSTGADFAEIYAEDVIGGGIVLIDGKVDAINNGRSHGVGIRVFKGLKSVYGYSNDLSLDSLVKVAKRVATVIDTAVSDKITFSLQKTPHKHLFPIKIYPNNVEINRKIALLKRMHKATSAQSSALSQITGILNDSDKRVLIANSEGLWTTDRRVRTRFSVNTVASSASENQMGTASHGRHMGFEMFDDLIDVEALGKEAARIATTMLSADYVPAGEMPVAIDNGFGGVIFHEACGHSLEATAVAKGISEFSGKLGEQIASPILTAIDDGTIAKAWGSQAIDDEGMPTQKNVLIKDGILNTYMIDKMGGRRMQMAPTGSARRQSYKFAPTSRMTNTYIAPGNSTADEIIKSIDKGLYARTMGGGSVNPATGEFNFAVLEGYLVEKGQIVAPVRGASLIGKGSEIIKRIDKIGNNLEYGTGMCGSVSGSIPVFVGQPMIRVSNMLVGGK